MSGKRAAAAEDEWDDDAAGGYPLFFEDPAAGIRAESRPAAATAAAVPATAKKARSSVSKTPTSRKAPAPIQGFAPELLDSLSTYDKLGRSNASAETRRANLNSRVARSNDKIANAAAAPPPVTVDDSLMRDEVGRMTQHYRQFSEYAGSERIFPRSGKRGREDHVDDLDDYGGDDYDDEIIPNYVSPDDEAVASRMLLAPSIGSGRIPDQGNSRHPLTFSEYTGPTPASAQFRRVLRHVQGPEQGVSMEVHESGEIYGLVSNTLAAPLRNQEINRIAVERGLSLPDLPKVSKAEIQDGLWAPNPALGERPCVFGDGCVSIRMCLDRKKEHPERYAQAEPFACKEFYFGKHGEEVRAAMAMGTPLNELQRGPPLMCVLCHLAEVTKGYKEYDLGLNTDPPHILPAFQVSAGVPGGYHPDKCLMGDNEFKGIIAPFLRFVPDVNYFWVPASGVMERDRVSGLMRLAPGSGLSRWLETECMDFQ